MSLAGGRARDTAAGRQAIAEQIARLREWCEREEMPWRSPSPEPMPVQPVQPVQEADHVG